MRHNQDGIKDFMTRQELETLASEKPQELALLFAQKVAGIQPVLYDPLAQMQILQDGQPIKLKSYKANLPCPNYLTDWTAVINAGKKAGIEWEKFYRGDRKEIFMTSQHESGGEGRTCNQQPNWPDCAALMIVMIEVMEGNK